MAAYGAVASKAWRGRYDIKMTWSERRTGRKIAASLIRDRASNESQHSLLLAAAHVRAKWRSLGSPQTPEVGHADSAEVADATDRLLESLGTLQVSVQGLDLAAIPFSELGLTLDALVADPDRLRLPHIHELRQILIGVGLGDVLKQGSVEVDVEVADAQECDSHSPPACSNTSSRPTSDSPESDEVSSSAGHASSCLPMYSISK